MFESEQGQPTPWDHAWREGYAKALEATLGVSYKRAYVLSVASWRPARNWRQRLARRLPLRDGWAKP